ncbi:MAG: 3-isopropylmalate dehydratase small subunit [Lutibacter sp.]
MEKFTTLSSTAVPLAIENIDTDQIIPARFLKATSKEGFGKNLFRDWRYSQDNQINPNFILNNPNFSGKILVAGTNFGCGSSREHAAWAIADYGFKVVISSYFADIFKGNALNNGILPIQVSEKFLQILLKTILNEPKSLILVNLMEQIVSIQSTDFKEHFEIDAYKKHCLINGFDDIDYLVSIKDKIVEFEKNRAEI